MKFEQLKMFGTGPYDIGIDVEPMPHMRATRYNDDGYYEGITLLARIKGGQFLGTQKQNSFEVLMFAPVGTEDYDGDRPILACFEFHSLTLDSASSGLMRYRGFLSAAEAYSQELYDSIASVTSQEELEKFPELTKSTGSIRYMPPVWEDAQKFLGWQANITMRPYFPEK